MDIGDLLEQRQRTHGNFREHANITQGLKYLMRSHGYLGNLNSSQIESLDMIAHKIGRILAGNPDEPDHWRDIAGYAILIERQLEK